jgi:hypothetical protein
MITASRPYSSAAERFESTRASASLHRHHRHHRRLEGAGQDGVDPTPSFIGSQAIGSAFS